MAQAQFQNLAGWYPGQGQLQVNIAQPDSFARYTINHVSGLILSHGSCPGPGLFTDKAKIYYYPLQSGFQKSRSTNSLEATPASGAHCLGLPAKPATAGKSSSSYIPDKMALKTGGPSGTALIVFLYNEQVIVEGTNLCHN